MIYTCPSHCIGKLQKVICHDCEGIYFMLEIFINVGPLVLWEPKFPQHNMALKKLSHTNSMHIFINVQAYLPKSMYHIVEAQLSRLNDDILLTPTGLLAPSRWLELLAISVKSHWIRVDFL